MKSRQRKPNYGIDAPQMGLALVVIVIVLIIAAFFLKTSNNEVAKSFASIIFSVFPTGITLIILILLYIKVEKFRHRDRMLNMLSWKGNEQVLDIGTGKGLLMIGAAKRLTTGKSFGIDIWNKADLSNNTYEAAIRNAELEGVKNKADIKNADAQQIPFEDNSFDYVLSNLCIHNIKTCRSSSFIMLSTVPADFHYSSFVHIFINSFSLGFCYRLTSINASTASSPARQTVKKLFDLNKSTRIISLTVRSALIKLPSKNQIGMFSKNKVADFGRIWF